ncbi:Na(+)/H(+) antiporter subunit D [Henriciella marina]|uniref:Na(+)/H(+) antiporter subunit D n=1 Tax=Henriciella marina TaxID=453851 RepID=A0ABT4LY64_9PROT|nr:Na(+)/H(+) antiporter subunit D [Henriciella marina]MCZ4298079.1 Na(+)/H(+) antiporter subunit D [Henriciella marina]
MNGLLATINPGLVLILAGMLAAVIPVQRVRQGLALLAPVIATALLLAAPRETDLASLSMMGFDMVLYRVDSLSFIFGLAFLIAAFINAVYALHQDSQFEDTMGLTYMGAAVAAAFCGDFISLFVFWELTAITSVFLIFRSGTQAAYKAGMRYLGLHILSGVLLLFGAMQIYFDTGDMSIRALELGNPGVLLVFLAFGIKAGFPFLHTWIADAYPKATVVGTVILSAFTTKLAIYALARTFAGEQSLVWIGAIMTIYPVFFAVVENDLRKVLSFSLNNQLGFMVCAIGVGTPLALNGAAAHAFCHIMYKSLLFMSMGAVLYRTGTAKATELGGLFRTMPWTTVFCLIGAASISAFPLFSGFVSKSLTMSAVAGGAFLIPWLMLLFASAGVLEHSGIKIPYFAFFGHDSGKRPKEAPFNMLVAMGLAAFICIAVGLPAFFPGFGFNWLYSILPFANDPYTVRYEPYTGDHILTQMQLLVLAIFAFALLQRLGAYPPEKRGIIIDTDIIYRKAGYGLATWAGLVWTKVGPAMSGVFGGLSARTFSRLEAAFSPRGTLASGGLFNGMAIWTAVLLGLALLIAFFIR